MRENIAPPAPKHLFTPFGRRVMIGFSIGSMIGYHASNESNKLKGTLVGAIIGLGVMYTFGNWGTGWAEAPTRKIFSFQKDKPKPPVITDSRV